MSETAGVEEPDFTEDDFAAVDRARETLGKEKILILPAVAKTLRIKPNVVARIRSLLFPQGDS